MYTPYLEPLANGKFRVNQKYVDPLRSTPKKKYLRKVSVTIKKDTAQAKNAAFTKLREKILAKVTDQLKGTDITLQELTDKYQEFLKETNRPWNTRQRALGNFKFINQYFSHAIAKNITTAMVNEYLEYCLYKRKRPLSNASTRLRKVFLSNAYNYGIKHGLVSSNPVKDINIQWKNEQVKKKDEIENKYLTTEELRAILGFTKYIVNRMDYYYFFKWLSSTGMRISEAAAITKKDVFHDDNEHIWYAMVSGNHEYHYGELYHKEESNKDRNSKSNHTKTIAGFRKVQLNKPALHIYNSLKDFRTDNEPLFLNLYFGTKKPWNTYTVDSYMKKIAFKLGINKPLTSHFFRHTYISTLAQENVPLAVIMAQVGQRDSEVTQQIYTHVTSIERQKLKTSLNKIDDDIGI